MNRSPGTPGPEASPKPEILNWGEKQKGIKYLSKKRREQRQKTRTNTCFFFLNTQKTNNPLKAITVAMFSALIGNIMSQFSPEFLFHIHYCESNNAGC